MDSQHRQHGRLHNLPSDWQQGTREIPSSLGKFASSSAAWERRVQSGQAGAGMLAKFTQVGRERALAMYGDWTDRIAKGELPSAAPQRPQGRERNVVVTMWDWADPKTYLPRRDRDRTSAIQPSTPTGRFMARSRKAPTICRSSIRARTPPVGSI
jgi:hypothetical protein